MAKGKYHDWLTDDGLTCVEGWAREGLTDKQIAEKIRISTETLYVWMRRFPAFSDTIKKGKAPVDIKVENSLLKRALGYTYIETYTDFEMVETGKDEDGKPILEKRIKSMRTIEKEVVPDVGAQAFWLKNRRPDLWREKREEQLTVTGADYSLLDGAAEQIRERLHGNKNKPEG